MGEGGARPFLGIWLSGWTQMAVTLATTLQHVASLTGESDAADALWVSLESQFELWRVQARTLAASARTPVAREALERFLDPGHWLFGSTLAPDPALRALISGPDSTALGAFGREQLRASPEWAALRRARGQHRALVATAWRRCFERVAQQAAGLEAIEALQDCWTTAAAAELDALHADPAFMQSMRALVMAAVALREAEAVLVEAFCEAHALPTRREVDDLHHAVTELRREVRALRRAREGQ